MINEQQSTTVVMPEKLGLPKGAIERDVTPDEIEAFVQFDDVSYFNSETPDDHRPPNFTNEEVKEAMDRGDIIRGIYGADGNFLAVSWFQPETEDNNMYVYSLNVSPKLRDAGIGAYFLGQAEVEAEKRGFDTCSLHVDPLNARGMHLYTKNGYRAVSYETDTEYGLNDWLIMKKQLSMSAETDQATGQEIEVAAGDEAELARILSMGNIGTRFLLDESKDPRQNKIVFSARTNK